MTGIEKAREEMTRAQATAEHADFMKHAGAILEKGMKFKAVMLKRGLTRARAKCPFCETGTWHGTLNGRKNHLHMRCDGCTVQMME